MLPAIRRSKTDQTRTGTAVAVPRSTHFHTCPVRAAMRLARTRRVGPLLVAVDRHGNEGRRLEAATVNVIVKRYVETVLQTDPSDYSAHSLRAGFGHRSPTASCPRQCHRAPHPPQRPPHAQHLRPTHRPLQRSSPHRRLVAARGEPVPYPYQRRLTAASVAMSRSSGTTTHRLPASDEWASPASISRASRSANSRRRCGKNASPVGFVAAGRGRGNATPTRQPVGSCP